MGFQFDNCSTFSTDQLRDLNLALTITGGIGSLLSILVVIVLMCIGAYQSVLQRLFLYGVFSTVIHEAVHFASIEQRFKYAGQSQVCAALGFLNNWTTWVVCDFHICIIGYLLCIVFYQLKRAHFILKIQSPLRKRFIEIACVVLCVILPAAILWPPFLNGMYGLDKSWCWTRAFDKNCNSTGIVDKFVYGYSFFEIVGVGAFITTIGIIVMYCTVASKYTNIRQLLRHTMILSLTIIIFMILLNFMLMVDLQMSDSYNPQIYFGVAASTKDLIFLGGYLLTFYGPICFKKKSPSTEKPRLKEDTGKEYGTFKESDRVSAPSSTFYEVQYTGGFTSVVD